jgi:D-serine deaminase-like pyridoxal phosphate-dependent protein
VNLEEAGTPCAFVDLDVLESNADRAAQKAHRLGVRLRPHVKTHKCVEAARIQVRGHFGGITVSTLAEAHAFAAAGFRDITYAVPFPLGRIQEAADLAQSVDALNLLLDNEATLAGLEAYGRARGVRFPVFLKVDCGYHRAGVDPERPESLELGVLLARSPHLVFKGVLTHAGQAYACTGREEALEIACRERDAVVRFAEKLRAEGVPVGEVSVGSTPTFSAVDDLEGATEARPGNYIFYDAFQAAIGSCSAGDLGFGVLATVIGHYPWRNGLLIDAGALALSKDPGPVHVRPDCGFGLCFSADGRRALPELRITGLSQEHGHVTGTVPLDYSRYPVGGKLRILPNHSCLAAALYDRYLVVKGQRVVDEWRPVRGW